MELEVKYQALLKKQQEKAYITEGKCWDDSDNDDESIKYVNIALMDNQDEASASTNQVPIIYLIKMSNAEYKMLVEKLTSEMFNVHTSMTAANEEIQKLSASNSKLIDRNEHLELSLMNTEALKQEVEYLKNKIVCADQIEKVLREKLAENELKIKAYQNSFVLVSAYHDKNQENCKIGIGFDYEAPKDKKNFHTDQRTFLKKKVLRF